MAQRKYTVREGFCYRQQDEKGNVKTYSEGDTVTLDETIGDEAHQLERVADKLTK